MKAMLTAVALLLCGNRFATAAPVEFPEISLLVRLRVAEPTIEQQVNQRRLLHPITPGQEASLRSQGAPEMLLAALHAPGLSFSEAEAEAFEAQREKTRSAMAATAAMEPAPRAEPPPPAAEPEPQAPPSSLLEEEGLYGGEILSGRYGHFHRSEVPPHGRLDSFPSVNPKGKAPPTSSRPVSPVQPFSHSQNQMNGTHPTTSGAQTSATGGGHSSR